MTQEEFNTMLHAAIAQGLPGGSFMMKYSWEEIEALLDKVAAMPDASTESGA